MLQSCGLASPFQGKVKSEPTDTFGLGLYVVPAAPMLSQRERENRGTSQHDLALGFPHKENLIWYLGFASQKEENCILKYC